MKKFIKTSVFSIKKSVKVKSVRGIGKSIFAWLMIMCFAFSAFGFTSSAAEGDDFDMTYYSKFQGQNVSINVFNWGQYMSDGSDDSYNIVKEFENLTGIKVNYSTYGTNEELYSKLKGGGADYDIVIPSDYMIGRFIAEDMIEKLDFGNIPNMQYTMTEFFNPDYDPAGEYSVPYTWGTVVLIYNTKYVDETVDSWEMLWNDKYKGKIIMFQNSRDAMCIALKKLGYSMNTTNIAELEAAAEELKIQKPLVQGYHMDEIFNKMGSNEAYFAPYYAGDAVNMIAENPDLAAVYPKEGTNRFVDAVCVPKGSKNKAAAEMFINFLCEPSVSAANAEYTEYCTPNIEAYELLDDEIKNNPITYPDDAVLANTEVFINLPQDVNEKIDELWTDILGSSGTGETAFSNFIFWGAIALLVVAVIAIAVVRYRKNKTTY